MLYTEVAGYSGSGKLANAKKEWKGDFLTKRSTNSKAKCEATGIVIGWQELAGACS
jgi:hypothetical protein